MKKHLLFCFLLMGMLGISQEEDLKVGLVLSGGGAKGLAHIGALKALEEAGIRIDYIGGSSMGAIIGGLYASGYSARQLDSIFHKTNFNILIQDDLPRRAKTFYEKEDSEKYALTLPFENFKLGLPSGLSRGQNVYNLMSRLTLHLGNTENFSDLPIPFFCVAADVETGEEVILDQGSLATAVSASSAIPSVFAPVNRDGRLLTDGGIANNYPVEELRRRGAEVIIGVDVQDSLLSRDRLKGVFDILTQISNFRTIQQMKEKIPKTDIYIRPGINKFSILSFDQGKEIIDSGYVATRKRVEELEALGARQHREAPKVDLPRRDTLKISSLTLEGNHNYPRSYILGKLRLNYFQEFTFEDLTTGINNLSATGNFHRINYRLLLNDDGYYTLAMKMEENQDKTFLRLGLHYDDLYKSAALVNLTRKSLFFTNDVTSFDLILGENSRYNLDYYIDKGYYWSIGLSSRYNGFEKNVFFDISSENARVENQGVRRLDLDFEDLTNQLYFATLFRQVFSFRVGGEHKYLRIGSETPGRQFPEIPGEIFENSHLGSVFGKLTYDSYDNRYFPSRGIQFNGDFHLYLLSSDFNENFAEFSIAKARLGYVLSPLDRLSFRLQGEGGVKIGNDESNTLDFFLGGYGNNLINNFIPFFGYDFISLSGDSYLKTLASVDYELFKKHHLMARANFANVGNQLFSSGEWFELLAYSGYSLGYGIETFIGPIEVNYSWSPESGSREWYFTIGFWF